MNSVNTNVGAMVALQSLNRTNADMASTQKKISTGFRVAEARDDGAAFAVAQKVRADVAGLTSANEQLGGVKGILAVTNTALKQVSETMKDVRATITKLGDESISQSQRDQYNSQLSELRSQIRNYVGDAKYNGVKLISDATETGFTAAAADITTVRNESSAAASNTLTLTAVTTGLLNAHTDITNKAGADTALAEFDTTMANIGTAMNTFGNTTKFVDAQISYNKEKIDALESGVGALVDADLAKESAKLQSLQIRQQLGTQALSMANQAPQALLGLFR